MGEQKNRLFKIPFFYGWIITALGFLALIASMGVRTSFGAFVAPWEIDFAVSRSNISLVSALGLVVYGICMPVAGNMADKYGARMVFSWSMILMGVSLIFLYFAQNIWMLYFLYGITASIGFAGASNVTASVAVVQWFKEKRGFVLGFMVAGMAAGQMLLVPVSIYLINMYDWRMTVLIYGLVYLILLTPVFFCFFRNRPADIGVKPYGYIENNHRNEKREDALSLKEVVKQIFRFPVTWFFIVPYFICGFTDIGLIHTHLIPLAEGRMMPGTLIAVVMSIYALVNLISTLFIGYLADRVNLTKLLATLFIIRGIGLIILLFADDPVTFLIFGFAGGITDFASIAPLTALCSKLYGSERVGTVFGVLSLFHQFGAAVGAFVLGVIFDLTGGYNVALVLCISLLVLSAALIMSIKENNKVELKLPSIHLLKN